MESAMAKTESVSLQMDKLLEEYSAEVAEVTEKAIADTAKEAAKKLRETSPTLSGDYAKGWAVRDTGNLSKTVYNKTDWRLTHLLENGHVKKNQYGEYGRWTPEKKHIAPVEEWAADELPEKIARGLT